MKAKNFISMGLEHIPIPISRYTKLFQSNPKIFGIYITEACNLRCNMCDIWKRVDIKNELTFEELIKLLDELKEMKIQVVGLSGGEPLLKPRVFEFIKEAKKRGFIVHINSNATLIKNAEKAKEIIESGLDSFTVSFDGLKELHDEIRNVPGTFERAVSGIKILLEERKKKNAEMRIATSTVIMKKNLYQIKELTLFLKDLGVDAIAFQPFTTSLMDDERAKEEHTISNPEDINELKKLIGWLIKLKKETGIIGNSFAFLKLTPDYFENKKLPACFAGYFNIDMDAKGNVYPCIGMPSVGNIRDNTLREIWSGEKYKNFRKKVLPNCQKCFIGCYGEPSVMYNPKYMLSTVKNMVNKLNHTKLK